MLSFAVCYEPVFTQYFSLSPLFPSLSRCFTKETFNKFHLFSKFFCSNRTITIRTKTMTKKKKRKKRWCWFSTAPNPVSFLIFPRQNEKVCLPQKFHGELLNFLKRRCKIWSYSIVKLSLLLVHEYRSMKNKNFYNCCQWCITVINEHLLSTIFHI